MIERRLWAIVLAGGEGSRLAETTERMYGSRLPKQFLSFGLERTFLQATVDRLQALIPSERTVVIVPARYLELAREQLRSVPGVELVAQPRNVGTGPGVLLPLSHVLKRDPRADVALVPSDHDFRAPAIMLQALLRAKRATTAYKSSMVLLGASADGPASDLGWIVTRKLRRSDAVPAIQEFVEKPAPALANSLFERGALWNTMLSVSRAEALWALAHRHLPEQTALFEEYAQLLGSSAAPACLSRIYERMPPADFSRDLVAASSGLRATTMAGAGWSDCGTPERLAAALAQGPALAKVGSAAFRTGSSDGDCRAHSTLRG